MGKREEKGSVGMQSRVRGSSGHTRRRITRRQNRSHAEPANTVETQDRCCTRPGTRKMMVRTVQDTDTDREASVSSAPTLLPENCQSDAQLAPEVESSTSKENRKREDQKASQKGQSPRCQGRDSRKLTDRDIFLWCGQWEKSALHRQVSVVNCCQGKT